MSLFHQSSDIHYTWFCNIKTISPIGTGIYLFLATKLDFCLEKIIFEREGELQFSHFFTAGQKFILTGVRKMRCYNILFALNKWNINSDGESVVHLSHFNTYKRHIQRHTMSYNTTQISWLLTQGNFHYFSFSVILLIVQLIRNGQCYGLNVYYLPQICMLTPWTPVWLYLEMEPLQKHLRVTWGLEYGALWWE